MNFEQLAKKMDEDFWGKGRKVHKDLIRHHYRFNTSKWTGGVDMPKEIRIEFSRVNERIFALQRNMETFLDTHKQLLIDVFMMGLWNAYDLKDYDYILSYRKHGSVEDFVLEPGEKYRLNFFGFRFFKRPLSMKKTKKMAAKKFIQRLERKSIKRILDFYWIE